MSKQKMKYKGKPAFQCMEEYLSEHHDFRYNVVFGAVEYNSKGEKGEYLRLNDFKINSILREMKWEGINVGVGELTGTLKSAFVQPYDPFIAYFEGLPEWDGEEHIQQLADTVTVQERIKDWWQIALRMWLIGCVACATDSNSTNHLVLVFVGAQGIGKTTWMNRLVPSDLKKHYFSGNINPNNKDTLSHLSECFLINLDELETLNRGELGSLKSVITQQGIRVRKPYGHFSENLTRRASFMGSVNSAEFLRDDTGNRRFLCFEASAINAFHNVDLDKVYAQAYALYKSGHRYWLEGEENNMVSTVNEQFKVQHPEIEIVIKYFDVCVANQEPDDLMSVAELQGYLLKKDEATSNLDLRRLGIALKASSFQRTKQDGIWRYKFKTKAT